MNSFRYVAGSATAIVGARVAVLLRGAPAMPIVDTLWPLAAKGAPLPSLLDVLWPFVRSGDIDFAVICAEPGGVSVVVRGQAHAVVADAAGSPVKIAEPGAATWHERHVDDAGWARLVVEPGGGEERALPLLGGVVHADVLEWRPGGVDALASDHSPRAAEDTPAGLVTPIVAATPTSSAHAPAPAPTTGGRPARSPMAPPTNLIAEVGRPLTPLISGAVPLPQAQPDAASFGTPSAFARDGQTRVRQTALPPVAAPGYGPVEQVYALRCDGPDHHPNDPAAPSCMMCGAPVDPDRPTEPVPQPVYGMLASSAGAEVALTHQVVVVAVDPRHPGLSAQLIPLADLRLAVDADLELRFDGWSVRLLDRAGGARVAPNEAVSPVATEPGRPMPLPLGSRIMFADDSWVSFRSSAPGGRG